MLPVRATQYWWAVWIGPQQQHEPGSSLGNKCALVYPIAQTQCPTQGCATFANITLRNVTITDPALSPGVILGNASNPMSNIVFDGVRVVSSFGDAQPHTRDLYPWGRAYQCEHAQVRSIGGTDPQPSCSP